MAFKNRSCFTYFGCHIVPIVAWLFHLAYLELDLQRIIYEILDLLVCLGKILDLLVCLGIFLKENRRFYVFSMWYLYWHFTKCRWVTRFFLHSIQGVAFCQLIFILYSIVESYNKNESHFSCMRIIIWRTRRKTACWAESHSLKFIARWNFSASRKFFEQMLFRRPRSFVTSMSIDLFYEKCITIEPSVGRSHEARTLSNLYTNMKLSWVTN